MRDAFGDVVEEQRFAADYDAALHAAALAIQRQRGELRDVQDRPVGPGVLGSDQVFPFLVGGDDEPVVRDDVGEQLVESFVHPFGLEALAELARCVEQ